MIHNLTPLFEGYGWLEKFHYTNFKNDPEPTVLILGHFVNHKGTDLTCGLNINGLTKAELTKLKIALPRILSHPKKETNPGDKPARIIPRTMPQRYAMGMALMPNVFKDRYRTYDSGKKQGTARETFTFTKTNEADQAKAVEIAKADGHPIESLDEFEPNDDYLKIEYLGKAVIDRELAKQSPTKKKPMPSAYPPTPPPVPTPPQTPLPPAPPPGPGGMAPMTPDQAVPGGTAPPPPPPVQAPPAARIPAGPRPGVSSPGRRVKKLPGREAPQAPPKASSGGDITKPALPLPPSSRQRREGGASKALDNREQRNFNKGKEQEKTEEGLSGTPEA